MTTTIPFLTDTPGAPALFNAPGLSHAGGVPAQTVEPSGPGTGGAVLDFAGLLGAELAAGQSPAAKLPAAKLSVGELLRDGAPLQTPAPATALPIAAAGGKIVPEPGAVLPLRQLDRVPMPGDGMAATGPLDSTGDPAQPRVQGASPDHTAADQRAEAGLDDNPSPEQRPPEPAELLALMPVATPVATPAPPPVLAPAMVPGGGTAPVPARAQRAAMMPQGGSDDAPLPARVTRPTAHTDTDIDPEPAPPAAPNPAGALPVSDVAEQAPSAPNPVLATAPNPAIAPPPAPSPVAAPDRIDARAVVPAPQQESAIAQVGDLREALRSARPELTLRHGEFGFVSLRLEPTGAENWRAVLASRDPGFVPAIQAALADRAVAAAASINADGGQMMGQHGGSDHRYGSSPNGGQGSPSPYLAQSGSRDGEAAPDHRRSSTAAAIAARADEAEEVSGSPGQQARGMFA